MDSPIIIGSISILIIMFMALPYIFRNKTEDDLYMMATEECTLFGDKNEGLWQKSLALTKGDKDKAKYIYINLRVKQLAKKYNVELSKETQVQEISKVELNTESNSTQEGTNKIHTLFINILRVVSFLPLLGLLSLIITYGALILITGLVAIDSNTTINIITEYAKIFDVMLFLIALYFTYKYVVSKKRTIIGLIVFIIISTLLYVALPFGLLALNDSMKQSNITGSNSEYWKKFYKDSEEEKAKLDRLCGNDMDCRLYYFDLETERIKAGTD